MSVDIKVTAKFDPLLLHFIKTPIKLIHPRRENRSQPLWDSAVTVQTTDTIPSVFETLIKENILSCPVRTPEGKCCGFIDMMDLVLFTVGLFNSPMDTELTEFFVKSRRFREASVMDVMGSSRVGWRPYSVPRDYSLFYGLETLGRSSQHRMAVTHGEKVVGVITESMMIGFLYVSLDKLGDAKQTLVSDIVSHFFVSSVQDTDPTIKAFRLMIDRKLSGLAVVNSKGELVDTISVRDLRGIGPEAEMFTRLWEPVADYKKRIRKMHSESVPLVPVVVLPTDTLETVIRLMETKAVHRVFVVKDHESRRPINVISQSDIIKFILPY